MQNFAYLHAHSEYSLTDGSLKIQNYVDWLSENNISVAALTDTHNLFGAVKFFQYAKENDLKPILGIDLFVKSQHRDRWRQANRLHLLVYVMNRKGYRNLSKMVSESYRQRDERGLHVPLEVLEKNDEGLYLLGPPKAGASDPKVGFDEEEFGRAVRNFKAFFGPRTGIEIPVYDDNNSEIKSKIEIARNNDIPAIPTRPAYFRDPADFETLKLRHSIQTNTKFEELSDLPPRRAEQHLVNVEKMKTLLPDREDQLLENTMSFLENCTFSFETNKLRIPDYPFGGDSDELLSERCKNNITRKTIATDQETARDRLNRELTTIKKMNFSDYFLIVADVVNWARNNNIRVGPGRGSAAGSFVAYLLNITTVDPFQYDLIFERFLNPDRNEMPDIDVDFADHQRQRVLEYIKNRFGRESVAQIITFGRMKARNSIRDIGRIRKENQDDIDTLAEKIPSRSDDTLKELIESESSSLKDFIENDEDLVEWVEQARKMEGYVRNPSIHAAGLLITEGNISESIPLYSDSGQDSTVASMFDMYDVETLGFLKLDILGLTTLTLIDQILDRIPGGEKPDLQDLPPDDSETLKLFADRELEGVFQFESAGGRRLAEEMKPDSKREVIDCIALNRPGPAQYRDEFLKRRRGDEPVEYPHPDLEDILEDTYGLIIYQEQVMAIARRVGGFSWSESDTMRKAMGKKKTKLMENLRQKFIDGAVDNGYEKKFVTNLFEKLAQFAEYGFNRSHSAAYGEITYQTAFLKSHFTEEFYAAFLTIKSNNRDRIRKIARAMEREDVKLLPPCVNRSSVDFRIDGNGIRYGLSAIKHVGTKLADRIVEVRRDSGFDSIYDFLTRIPPQLITSKTFKSLAASGGFDRITDRNRGTLIDESDHFLGVGERKYSEAQSGQSRLFDGEEKRSVKKSIDGNWSEGRLNDAQREAIGLIL